MGRKLAEAAAIRPSGRGRGGPLLRRRLCGRRGIAIVGLLLGLAAAGCADHAGDGSDNDRRGGFYGGVTGGYTVKP